MAAFADIADKLARNEIASANDLRQAIGWKPSKDPKADKLINSNMPQPAEPGAPVDTETPEEEIAPDEEVDTEEDDGGEALQSALDGANSTIDEILESLDALGA
jgi:hypothetical protein